MTKGLTLGKFAPLHKGHQLLIETGLSETDEMMVIIYDSPEVTDVPLAVRAGWIRALYPNVQVIEAWDGPSEIGYTSELMRSHERYVIDALKVRGVTHFYSSERYGAHMSAALGAMDRRVDGARLQFPVSATAVRAAPYAHRQYLHPIVYRDLITKVVFIGAPCSGKTTLAERMAEDHKTVWMPEYGREYWEKHQVNRRLTPDQLVRIAEAHIEREESLLQQANRYLFVDTNAVTTLTFARYYHGSAPLRLEQLASQALVRYDLVFLCDIDFPYQETCDRSGDTNRTFFQRQVISDLNERHVPFLTLHGSVDDRANRARELLSRYRKYSNLLQVFGGDNE